VIPEISTFPLISRVEDVTIPETYKLFPSKIKFEEAVKVLDTI
jgi:hypothetical protein